MKTLHLLASFAVAVTVVGADLKDPSEVAQSWEENTYVGHAQFTGDLSLRRQTVFPAPYATWPVFISDCWSYKPRVPDPREKFKLHRNGDVLEVPPDLNSDKGILKILADSDKLPPGAKPWDYRGQKFWLIPIASDGSK